jgi:hypothetical protein
MNTLLAVGRPLGFTLHHPKAMSLVSETSLGVIRGAQLLSTPHSLARTKHSLSSRASVRLRSCLLKTFLDAPLSNLFHFRPRTISMYPRVHIGTTLPLQLGYTNTTCAYSTTRAQSTLSLLPAQAISPIPATTLFSPIVASFTPRAEHLHTLNRLTCSHTQLRRHGASPERRESC